MNNPLLGFYGFVAVLLFVAVIAVALIGGGAILVHEATTWHASNNTVRIVEIGAQRDVDVQRLQSQERITIGCMQNSWLTSMRGCISAGGVNGTGSNWLQWAMITAFLVAVWKMAISWLEGDEE
jgi:hypothetical protein